MHGKVPETLEDSIIFMEIDNYFPLLSQYLPNGLNDDFKEYLANKDLIKIDEMSDYLVMNLPNPRVSYYESSDYDEIQNRVTEVANSVTEKLGFFSI